MQVLCSYEKHDAILYVLIMEWTPKYTKGKKKARPYGDYNGIICVYINTCLCIEYVWYLWNDTQAVDSIGCPLGRGTQWLRTFWILLHVQENVIQQILNPFVPIVVKIKFNSLQGPKRLYMTWALPTSPTSTHATPSGFHDTAATRI